MHQNSENQISVISISSKLSELTKPLDNNIKYQVISIAIFCILLNSDNQFTISFWNINFEKNIILYFFPLIITYLAVRNAFLTMLFIERLETYMFLLKKIDNPEEREIYRFYRPTSIFLSIIAYKHPKKRGEVKSFLFWFFTMLLYSITGLTLGISSFLFYKISFMESDWSIYGFFALFTTIVLQIVLGMEYLNKANKTSGYKSILFSVYFFELVSFLVLITKIDLSL